LIGISLNSFAQKSFFGVDAGVNIANQRVVFSPSGPYYSSSINSQFYQNTVKPTFGVFYQSNFSESVGVRLAIQYMGLGYKDRLSNQHSVNINYLTFPLSLHYTLNKKFSIHSGGYLSFTLHNTKVTNQSNAIVSVTSVYHDNDTGIFLGGEHCLGKDFFLAVNYFIGTKNIWLNDNNGAVKYNNRALQFTLIYKFKKKS
jgi:hypothetical protein